MDLSLDLSMFIRGSVKCITWICQSWHMWHGFVFTYFQCLWPLNLQHNAYFPSTLSTAMWVCVSVCGVWKRCLEDINSGIAQKCKFFIWPPLSFWQSDCLRYTHPRHATILILSSSMSSSGLGLVECAASMCSASWMSSSFICQSFCGKDFETW